MGEAKRRGTYEERKAQAIERDRLLAKRDAEIRRRRGKSISPVVAAIMCAYLADVMEQPEQESE